MDRRVFKLFYATDSNDLKSKYYQAILIDNLTCVGGLFWHPYRKIMAIFARSRNNDTITGKELKPSPDSKPGLFHSS
jgi:hypothetical protein